MIPSFFYFIFRAKKFPRFIFPYNYSILVQFRNLPYEKDSRVLWGKKILTGFEFTQNFSRDVRNRLTDGLNFCIFL